EQRADETDLIVDQGGLEAREPEAHVLMAVQRDVILVQVVRIAFRHVGVEVDRHPAHGKGLEHRLRAEFAIGVRAARIDVVALFRREVRGQLVPRQRTHYAEGRTLAAGSARLTGNDLDDVEQYRIAGRRD